jgi:uncharacterized protein (TIGR03437 family)
VAPGLIEGVLQINLLVPEAVSPGGTVPLDVTINGVTSKAGITVAIN